MEDWWVAAWHWDVVVKGDYKLGSKREIWSSRPYLDWRQGVPDADVIKWHRTIYNCTVCSWRFPALWLHRCNQCGDWVKGYVRPPCTIRNFMWTYFQIKSKKQKERYCCSFVCHTHVSVCFLFSLSKSFPNFFFPLQIFLGINTMFDLYRVTKKCFLK